MGLQQTQAIMAWMPYTPATFSSSSKLCMMKGS
ncbi:hypothetical protein AAFF_G00234680 [Aldrovandia affinis]|uniref:Uncharacterized protein n=1 Tax=Aldrovandia affinis TaxID=143900 RepID=A0AAD7SV68_9TELE|nr:hypothetical protein AAFF_G00234680 [Aldrovandia affinis]